jgi:hypothetical protein
MEIKISTSELSYLIDEWIFNERNRKIVKRKLIDGITFERLAEEFDLSVQQVKTIVYKSQALLACHL